MEDFSQEFFHSQAHKSLGTFLNGHFFHFPVFEKMLFSALKFSFAEPDSSGFQQRFNYVLHEDENRAAVKIQHETII